MIWVFFCYPWWNHASDWSVKWPCSSLSMTLAATRRRRHSRTDMEKVLFGKGGYSGSVSHGRGGDRHYHWIITYPESELCFGPACTPATQAQAKPPFNGILHFRPTNDGEHSIHRILVRATVCSNRCRSLLMFEQPKSSPWSGVSMWLLWCRSRKTANITGPTRH